MSNEIYLQIYNLLSGEWRNGSEPQKDRALFDCSLLEVDGLGALVAAGKPSGWACCWRQATRTP